MTQYLLSPLSSADVSTGPWFNLTGDGGTVPASGDDVILATLPQSGAVSGAPLDLSGNALSNVPILSGTVSYGTLDVLGSTALVGGTLSTTASGLAGFNVGDGATVSLGNLVATLPTASFAALLDKAAGLAGFPAGDAALSSAIDANLGSLGPSYGGAITVQMAFASTLTLGGYAGDITIDLLDHSDTIILSNPTPDTITLGISGFDGSQGDRIDLVGVGDVASFTAGASPVLTTTTGQTFTFTNFSGSSVNAVSDGHGGVDIACYARGTLIRTATGDRPVETLTVGQRLLTAAGGTRPIVWIGRRDYGAAFVAANRQLRPVRIAAGALSPLMGGRFLPKRTLCVSPQHALLIDGSLVPAAALAGVPGIDRAPVDTVSYWHVELDAHDAILAEGVPAESFRDESSRGLFQRSSGVAGARSKPCAPRVAAGDVIDALRARLGASVTDASAPGRMLGHVERRVGDNVEGWVLDTARSAPVLLELLADGVLVASLRADVYRTDLDRAGLADGRCGFRAAVPAGARVVQVRRADDGIELGWMEPAAVAA